MASNSRKISVNLIFLIQSISLHTYVRLKLKQREKERKVTQRGRTVEEHGNHAYGIVHPKDTLRRTKNNNN